MLPPDEGLRRFFYDEFARYVHELKHQFLRWITSNEPRDLEWMCWERPQDENNSERVDTATIYL